MRPRPPGLCPHLPNPPRMQAREGRHSLVTNIASVISIEREAAASEADGVTGTGQAPLVRVSLCPSLSHWCCRPGSRLRGS